MPWDNLKKVTACVHLESKDLLKLSGMWWLTKVTVIRLNLNIKPKRIKKLKIVHSKLILTNLLQNQRIEFTSQTSTAKVSHPINGWSMVVVSRVKILYLPQTKNKRISQGVALWKIYRPQTERPMAVILTATWKRWCQSCLPRRITP